MPAKGTYIIAGERYNPLTKELYNQFIEKEKIDIDFATFKAIIENTNKAFKEAISEQEDGLQLPHNLGSIIVTMYKRDLKRKEPPTDWIASIKLKRKVPLLNLHSFGYVYHIKWFRIGAICANVDVFKFHPYRILKRKVAANVKNGKKYFPWENTDLWSTTRMERKFNKIFKKK